MKTITNSLPPTTPVKTFTFDEVASHYSFPDNQGEDVTIGILAWQPPGGINLDLEDIKKSLKNSGLPIPNYQLKFEGGQTHIKANGGELNMDVSIVSNFCPKATIIIYMATPETVHTIIHQAVVDGCSVTTSSFGIHDKNLVEDIDKALVYAASNDVTTCFASGDSGAGSGQFVDSVVFPAGHPNALAVGGTFIPTEDPASPTTCGSTPINEEQVWWNYPGKQNSRSWWGSGGGVSTIYDVPSYQKSINPTSFPVNGVTTHGRGVPDIAAFAQGLNNDKGTSAATPTMASMIVRINSQLKTRVGDIHDTIYSLDSSSGAFKSITNGCNIPPAGQNQAGNGYVAQAGWDACTGLGIPNGQKLLKALQTL
ncbi:S53 family peptidase [Aquimarina sp. 2201CG5-10]|uniref:S53 family peptidase n=1 Tax=Aquimarina callyspongiae TaxID=3098150 RepID=UPI002AB43E6F|nr:S53 family peptidase [Aquimarina sp. 2201CG5-10]MDY8136252.1 S53 family peptidase [Aquimarina sp. 2201CG5-10]